jgi:protein-disulfide isomerase
MRLTLLLPLLSILLVSLTACGWPNNDLPPFSNSWITIDAPTYGSGPHTITIYSDYQCPACIMFHKQYGKILDSYAEKWQLKIVYKQYPLYPKPHANALRDAYGALCAHAQGKFREFSDAMYTFEDGKNNSSVSDAERGTVAQGAWVPNIWAFNQCLASDTYAKQVSLDRDEWDRKNIPGTPAIFLDDTRLESSLIAQREAFLKFLETKLNPTPLPSTASGTGESGR